MKKLISISLLFVFLSASKEFQQLLKFPVLIHHFFDHHDEKHETTITSYLSQHYSDQQNKADNDHHDHEKLPFKTQDYTASYISLAIINPFQFSISKELFFHRKITPIYKGVHYSSTLVNNIWQPPKF